ncbi:MAG: hypothetical protein E5V96_08830 [Mesorhizobium sp.]|nr:MAG: hypothetical protein E5V96_08830 [Mesorhizobium sp.]
MSLLTSAIIKHWNNLPAEDREQLFASLRSAVAERKEAACAYQRERAQVIRAEMDAICARSPLATRLPSAGHPQGGPALQRETARSGDVCRDR